ncbi:MAG: LapA family protein [Acidimicrobiia bacterium]
MTMANDRDGNNITYRGTGFYASLVVALILAAALLIFAVQNTGTVTVEWLSFELTGPLFAWVIGAALLAIVLDELVGLVWRARERNRLTRLERHRRISADAEDVEGGLEKTIQAEIEAETPSSTSDLAQETHRYDESRR